MKISILAAAILLILPSSAGAAVIVGADNLAQNPGAGAGTCGSAPGEPCSWYTITQHDGVAETGSPITGVLVSARVQTSGDAVTVGVRVLRANPMMALTFLNVGPEIPIPVTADATMPGHMTEATGLHHPINAGDRLAVGWTNPGGFFSIWANAPPSLGACGYLQGPSGDHPVGTERTYGTAGCAGEALVQGTVEPDADGDTFGDETQDQCSTSAATAGPCPASTPPAGNPPGGAAPSKTKKCKKKKKKPKGASAAKGKCKKKGR